MDEREKEAELSLVKANRACKLICFLMKLIFSFVCVWWVVTIAIMLISLIDPDVINNVGYLSFPALIAYVFSCMVMSVVCITLIRIFSDVSKGCSPFTMIQVRRLRLMAISLVVYSVLEFGITYCSSFLQYEAIGSSVATINLFTIIAAAVVFAFSFVFKYGVLLQEFSDETL